MKRSIWALALFPAAIVMAGGLSGCGSNTVQEAVGLERQVPDEFQVVRRKPLVVPPDATLRPPESGVGQVDSTVSNEARDLVIGNNQAARQSAVERALLSQTSVQALPNIRSTILEETTQRTQLQESRFLFILNFQREQFSEADPINALKEAERLQAEGRARKVVTIKTGQSQSESGGS